MLDAIRSVSFLKKLFPFFLIFLTALNFTVVFLDVKISSLLVAASLSFLYLFICFLNKRKIVVSRSIFVLLLLVAALEVIVLFQVVVFGYFEYNVYSFPFRVILYSLVVVSLVNYFYNNYFCLFEAKSFFLKAVVLSFVFNSIIILVEVYFQDLRDLIYGFLDLGKVMYPPYYGYRYTGVMQSLPVVSFHHFIAALCALYIALNEKKIIYYVVSFFVVGVLVFVARSGIYLFFIFLFLFAYSDRFYVKVLATFLSVFSFSLLLLFDFSYFQTINNRSVGRTFEMLSSFQESGSLATSSTSDLVDNHWSVFPDNIYSWFFGYGTTVTNIVDGIDINTDVGVLKLIFFFGVFGLLLVFYIHLYLAYSSQKVYSKYFKLFILSLVGSVFIFNLKDYALFGGTAFFILVFFSASTVLKNNKWCK